VIVFECFYVAFAFFHRRSVDVDEFVGREGARRMSP
jgi:hypothetical protein